MNQERLTKVIVAPVISEKATLVGETRRQVVFEVLPDATKAEIKAAVELLFKDGRAHPALRALPSAVSDADTALRELVRSRLEAAGPVTAETLARLFGRDAGELAVPLAGLEQEGVAMRGRFISGPRSGARGCA